MRVNITWKIFENPYNEYHEPKFNVFFWSKNFGCSIIEFIEIDKV